MINMQKRRILNVSYCGIRQAIAYKIGSTYDEILKRIVLHFKIPRHQTSTLQLRTEAGKVFSRRQISHYLALFPASRITFYLLHCDKKDAANAGSNAFSVHPESLKRLRDCDDDDDDSAYPTTPVFRMNCFVGVYPSKCSAPRIKRVRFSEALNCIKVIPARRPQTNCRVAGALRRTNSFIGEYPENRITSQRPILGESVDQSNNIVLKRSSKACSIQGYPKVC